MLPLFSATTNGYKGNLYLVYVKKNQFSNKYYVKKQQTLDLKPYIIFGKLIYIKKWVFLQEK